MHARGPPGSGPPGGPEPPETRNNVKDSILTEKITSPEFNASTGRDFSTGAAPDLVIQPKEQHEATVFWVHGLGDSGAGWDDPMRHISQELANVRFVLPTA
eukprot:Clim_evm80s243 gene=Clim_evmTU80s243